MPQLDTEVGDALFRALVESAPDGILIVGSQGRVVLVNSQTERLFGYGRGELIGNAIEMLVPERLREAHQGHRTGFMGHAQLRPMGAGLELSGRKKDGSEFPLEISLSPVSTPSGTLVCAIVRDVTERKRSERRFRTLLDSAPDAMVVVSGDGQIELVNPQTEKLFGYQRHELIGQRIEILIPGRLRKHHGEQRAKYAENPQLRPMGIGLELYGRRKDGSEFPVEVSLNPHETDEGLFVTSTVRDITERKRIETALRQSEATFRSMVEGTYGVCRAGLDGTLYAVNDALVTMLGYGSQQELLAANLAADIFQAGEFSPKAFDVPGRNKHFARMEARWRCKDCSLITVELSGRMLRVGDEEAAVLEILAENISPRLGMEQRLRHVQKMEAIGRLAGGIAHDFNNVLGVISGYSAMLAEKLDPGSPLSRMTDQLTKAVDRGATLTRQLLAFSRQQVLQPRVININEHLHGFERLLHRVIGEDVRLRVITDASPLLLRADPDQLEQVIMNLVVNARDAMPDGGHLTIETSRSCVDEGYCLHSPDVKPGEYVLIAVSDTGCGMDREVLSRVFEPFFTTKEAGKGTGLGLATVYGIVRQSGGHVIVYSEVGHGTTFKILLPLCADGVASAEARPSERIVPSGKELILLVEDEESLRIVTKGYLEGKGYRVADFGNPEGALGYIRSAGEKPCVLLTDVVLPHTSGVVLARQTREICPGIKVLYVSGYTADAIAHDVAMEPDFAFVSKPFSLGELARKLRVVIDSPPLVAVAAAADPAEGN